jgi:CBS domain-containing protein
MQCIKTPKNDRLVGMITDRDIACRGFLDGKNASRLTARNVMSKGIIYCTDSDELEDAIHLMQMCRGRLQFFVRCFTTCGID